MIVYQIFIKKTPIDINEGLENRIIVESLTLPQVFTAQENMRIVTDLAPKKPAGSNAGQITKEEAERNAEIIKSLMQ